MSTYPHTIGSYLTPTPRTFPPRAKRIEPIRPVAALITTSAPTNITASAPTTQKASIEKFTNMMKKRELNKKTNKNRKQQVFERFQQPLETVTSSNNSNNLPKLPSSTLTQKKDLTNQRNQQMLDRALQPVECFTSQSKIKTKYVEPFDTMKFETPSKYSSNKYSVSEKQRMMEHLTIPKRTIPRKRTHKLNKISQSNILKN
tara:strand:+ start:10465 stop:11070 length:606 start_codon:yes stop_codon:yes gene_type:complete